jgi:hypothetical protein
MAKPHLTINIHLKNEGQEGKTDPVLGRVDISGRGRVHGEGEGG